MRQLVKLRFICSFCVLRIAYYVSLCNAPYGRMQPILQEKRDENVIVMLFVTVGRRPFRKLPIVIIRK